jgi:hypothetical protein
VNKSFVQKIAKIRTSFRRMFKYMRFLSAVKGTRRLDPVTAPAKAQNGSAYAAEGW